jgi:hypothetical protein
MIVKIYLRIERIDSDSTDDVYLPNPNLSALSEDNFLTFAREGLNIMVITEKLKPWFYAVYEFGGIHGCVTG